jgi:hypothetical protein
MKPRPGHKFLEKFLPLYQEPESASCPEDSSRLPWSGNECQGLMLMNLRGTGFPLLFRGDRVHGSEIGANAGLQVQLIAACSNSN